ncbi:hypothetical protein IAT38_002488 [Cryptococcus sp. DSM 104549]
MFSVFGDESKLPPSTVMRGTSKKALPKPPPASSSSPAPSRSGGLTPKPSLSSLKPSSSRSSPLSRASSSTSLKSTPKPKAPSGSAVRAKSHLSRPRTPAESMSPGRAKRKAPAQVQRIESESSSSSDSDDGVATPGLGSGSGADARSKRARLNGAALMPGEEGLGREVFCLDKVDMRGEWGRGWAGFVGCEEVVRGHVEGWAGGGGGEGEAKMMAKYRAFFPQPGFEKDADVLPSVELLYPAKGCREKFILLLPTSDREYSPIRELRKSIHLILEHYIPPSHRHIFGTLDDSLDLPKSLLPSRVASPLPSTLVTPPPDPSSPGPTTSTPSTAAATIAPGTPTRLTPFPADPLAPDTTTIADAIRISLAPNRPDGPAFLRAVARFNAALSEIQEDGSMAKWLEGEEVRKGKDMKVREWAGLVEHVHETAYSRVVGMYSNELEHHPKHPDEVAKAISDKEDAYGELGHAFMTKIIEQTGLGPDSVFVDLGSGVGNCVLQAAIQAGCRSYGFELLPVPAHCARLQVREVQRRWAMWGLAGNLDLEVHEGDFRVHPEVARRLKEADVVLVNNEVFPSSLNHELTHLFLDLKEGARIVSLKPFMPEGFRMNEGNCNSFSAILRSTEYEYYAGWVSWKSIWGKYYLQVIDRTMRAEYEESLMAGRRRR